MAAPTTSVPNGPEHIPPDSEGPVRYGNGEITLAVTDLSAPGFGLDFTHTRIFSNRLADDTDFGNGYNWLIRDLPHWWRPGPIPSWLSAAHARQIGSIW